MRKDIISAVADAIESRRYDLGFSMSSYCTEAGEAAIALGYVDHLHSGAQYMGDIIGWTTMLYDFSGHRRDKALSGVVLKGVIDDDFSNMNRVAKILGLSIDTFLELACPEDRDWSEITAEEAVCALRTLAATGEVIWPEPGEVLSTAETQRTRDKLLQFIDHYGSGPRKLNELRQDAAVAPFAAYYSGGVVQEPTSANPCVEITGRGQNPLRGLTSDDPSIPNRLEAYYGVSAFSLNDPIGTVVGNDTLSNSVYLPLAVDYSVLENRVAAHHPVVNFVNAGVAAQEHPVVGEFTPIITFADYSISNPSPDPELDALVAEYNAQHSVDLTTRYANNVASFILNGPDIGAPTVEQEFFGKITPPSDGKAPGVINDFKL